MDLPRDTRILISSAGRRVALMQAFEEALEALCLRGEIYAADMSRCSAAFQHATRAFEVPPCTEVGFLQRLLEICKDEGVSLLVPTIDTELPIYARNRDSFSRVGTTLAISKSETIEIAGSKARTHEWLGSQGLPTVRQVSVDAFLHDPDAWEMPVIAKPVVGSSSIGIVRAEDPLELAPLRGRDYVVQSIAPGVEYTVSTFVDRAGDCLAAVPRRRLEVRGGEVSKGVTVRLPAVEDLAKRAVEALPGAYGPLNVQIFHDVRSQTSNIIEINARFGGGCPLAIRAGVPSPRWLIEDALGQPLTLPQPWEAGLVMLRYDDARFVSATAAGLRDDGEPMGNELG